jgi:hypothetical protein
MDSLHMICTCKLSASASSTILYFPQEEARGHTAAAFTSDGDLLHRYACLRRSALFRSLCAQVYCYRVLLRRLRPANLSSDSLMTTALTLLTVALPPALMDVVARCQSDTISVGTLASCGVVTPVFCCTVSSPRSSEPAALTRCSSLTSTTSGLSYQRSKCSYSLYNGQDKIGPAGVTAQDCYTWTSSRTTRCSEGCQRSRVLRATLLCECVRGFSQRISLSGEYEVASVT